MHACMHAQSAGFRLQLPSNLWPYTLSCHVQGGFGTVYRGVWRGLVSCCECIMGEALGFPAQLQQVMCPHWLSWPLEATPPWSEQNPAPSHAPLFYSNRLFDIAWLVSPPLSSLFHLQDVAVKQCVFGNEGGKGVMTYDRAVQEAAMCMR